MDNMSEEGSDYEEKLEEDIKEEIARSRGELGDDLNLWEECYKRFKPEFDRLARSDKEIKELEAKLEAQNRVVKVNLDQEKNKIMAVTAVFALTTIVFLRIVFSGTNPMIYFVAGLLVGIGWATLLRTWKR